MEYKEFSLALRIISIAVLFVFLKRIKGCRQFIAGHFKFSMSLLSSDKGLAEERKFFSIKSQTVNIFSSVTSITLLSDAVGATLARCLRCVKAAVTICMEMDVFR